MLFEPNVEMRKGDVEGVAQRVAGLVAEHLPPHGSWSRIDHGNNPPPHWPRQIHSMSISRLVKYERTYWHANDIDWIPDLTIELVQDVIAGKNAKAEGYDRGFRELWLLLSMHHGRLSSTFEIPAETRAALYQSIFRRVSLFEEVAGLLVELNVEGAG
jgi:hypothetical protein